jgi:hypothetical protein
MRLETMATPDFTHYLITRFNIPVDARGPEKMNSAHMNETFLRQRLSLFQQYCVPSVLSQTTHHFTWLLYFDRKTDPAFLEQVSLITKGPVTVKVILVESFEEFLKSIRDHILHSPSLFCITTRLDNDDLISQDFMQAVQRRFIPSHRTLINFTQGFEIDLTHHVIKNWTTRYNNQFTSLIENRELSPISGIYGFSHVTIPEDISIMNIGEAPRWAYTRHEFNFSPQKVNVRPVLTTKKLKGFPSIQAQLKISLWNTVKYSRRWLWKKGKDKVKKLMEERGGI